MRVAIFFLSMFSFLLAKANVAPATANSMHFYSIVTASFSQDDDAKFNAADDNFTIIQETDLDLDDDFQSSTDVASSNKLFQGKYKLTNKWYVHHSSLFFLNYHQADGIITPTFCGDSAPIYIKQRVLRI